MLSNKTLIIIIVILILLAGGFLAYYYLKGEPETTIKPETAVPPVSQPDSDERIKPVSQGPVLGVAVGSQKVKYYLRSNGNVFESGFDGSNPVKISSSVLPNLFDAIWSPDKNKVIVSFNQNEEIKRYFYDYRTERSVQLDDNIRWITWSPDRERIAYQYYNPETEENNISIAEPDGSGWVNIFSTRMKDIIIEWPESGKISVRTKPSGLAQSIVYALNLATGNLNKIIDQTYGLTVLWSPLGDKILLSETNSQGKKIKLKVLDLTKQTQTDLGLATLPEKCVWSQDNRTIFCAAPRNISDFAVLPDDYYKGLISFSDGFWRISLDTKQMVQIHDSEKTSVYDAVRLFLSPQEDYLLFTNQKDGWLYSLKL